MAVGEEPIHLLDRSVRLYILLARSRGLPRRHDGKQGLHEAADKGLVDRAGTCNNMEIATASCAARSFAQARGKANSIEMRRCGIARV